MSNKLEQEIHRALDELAESVRVIGPVKVERHVNYVVTGLADTCEQKTNLCWGILAFIGGVIELDFTLDSIIGEGSIAVENLKNALKKRLEIGKPLSLSQKKSKRDSMLQELISHVLLVIQQRQEKFSLWSGTIQAISRPHLSPNDSGIDLIAIGMFPNGPVPVIGEVKAYEKDPWGGLDKACVKFTQVNDGDYDDEIREALKSLSKAKEPGFTKQQLANNIWREQGRFGALVGHDCQFGSDDLDHIDINFSCNRAEVLKQNPERLFFISSPFTTMMALFDSISDELATLANQLAE